MRRHDPFHDFSQFLPFRLNLTGSYLECSFDPSPMKIKDASSIALTCASHRCMRVIQRQEAIASSRKPIMHGKGSIRPIHDALLCEGFLQERLAACHANFHENIDRSYRKTF